MEEEKKEELINEDKMKKKFGTLRKIMTVIKGLLIAGLIIVIVSITILSIVFGLSKSGSDGTLKLGKNNKIVLFDKKIEDVELKTVIIDILDVKEELEDDEDYINGSESLKTLMIVIAAIVSFVGYLLVIMIVDNLAQIFGEVEKEGTPFTENNIKLLKKVNILALILWIAGMMGTKSTVGLVFLIVIFAFRSVFEYGYKLQKESDETL